METSFQFPYVFLCGKYYICVYKLVSNLIENILTITSGGVYNFLSQSWTVCYFCEKE